MSLILQGTFSTDWSSAVTCSQIDVTKYVSFDGRFGVKLQANREVNQRAGQRQAYLAMYIEVNYNAETREGTTNPPTTAGPATTQLKGSGTC